MTYNLKDRDVSAPLTASENQNLPETNDIDHGCLTFPRKPKHSPHAKTVRPSGNARDRHAGGTRLMGLKSTDVVGPAADRERRTGMRVVRRCILYRYINV